MVHYRKFWIIFITVACCLFLLIFILINFGHPTTSYYTSASECINAEIEKNKTHSIFENPELTLTYKDKIMSYENETQYCEFYSSLDDTVYFIILDKTKTDDGIKYNCKNIMTFIYYSDDVRNLEGYEFQCADSIEQIKIDGAELNEIIFTLNGEPYKRILAFKDNTSTYSER